MLLEAVVLGTQLWATFGGVTLPQIPQVSGPCATAVATRDDAIAVEPQSVNVDGSNVTVIFNIPVPPAVARRVNELDLEAPYYTRLDDQQIQYTDAKAYIDPQISVPIVVRFQGLARGPHRLRVGYFQIQKRARKATMIESHFQVCFRTPGSIQIQSFKSAP